MFRREYLFETRESERRRKRFFIKVIFFVLIVFISSLYLYIFLRGENLSLMGQQHYFKKSPDLIVVFTGDRGRIQYALDKSLKFPESKILISGVYKKNNLKILLNAHFKKEGFKDVDAFSRIIEIDFVAKNTMENVLMTLELMRKEKSLNKALIVSSDYHLPRIELLFYLLRKDSDGFDVKFEGKITEGVLDKIWKMTLEIAKTFKSLFTFFLYRF